MRIIIGIILALAFNLAYATGGSKPPVSQPTPSTAHATATGGSAVVTATGGSLTTNTGAVTVGGQSIEGDQVFAAPGLATSANACQGSVSILAVGFTFDVIWCRTLEKARAMYQFGGAGTTAIKAQLCRDEEIREAYRVAGQPCP